MKLPHDTILSLRKGPENADTNMPDTTELKEALAARKRGAYDQKLYEVILNQFFPFLEHCATVLAGIMDTRPRKSYGASGLEGVKATRDKPIFEVCGEVVAEKLSGTSAMSLLGTFMREFPGRMDKAALAIRESKRFAAKFDIRKEFATDILEARNGDLGEDIRLTKELRRILMRQMESFAWPFDGAWTERAEKGPDDAVEKPQIGFPKEKWPRFIEALEVNLNDLKIALGFDARAKLPPEIAKLAVTYLAQIDPRVSQAVKSLTENEYNALLASIGQNPAAEMLGAAIGAIKAAPDDKDLLVLNPEAANDFKEIDEDADKIDPSPANILKQGVNLFRKGQ